MTKVIKRDCTEVDFDKSKISAAILKAMKNGSGIVKQKIAEDIANEIEEECKNKEDVSISDIESMVYDKLITKKQRLTAKAYEGYRSIREFQRENENTTDSEIDELLDGESEYWNTENSNKNSKVLNTQRDYMAGIVSKDISRRFLLPPEVVQAHDEGIIHFHDIDYFGMNAMSNCSLINLEDMLQNGTCINKVMIEKPHRFITACTIATQIILGVTSLQYGGATITLTHLAPFVRDSYNKYYEKYKSWGFSNEDCKRYAESDTKKEVADGVQTFNYQCNSMSNSNGQSPFLSVFMYLGETTEYKKELAMIIEEFLNQRLLGLKNEVGVYVTQAFPKLLYVLEEDNIHENSPFGIIKGITDRNYITNSYHTFVKEPINAFDKLAKESEFQALSLGGAISYVETDGLVNNVDAVLEMNKFIYDHIMYAEENTKSDYCQVCGYDGEIKIIDEGGELIWECPNCHNRDKDKMNVARRTCGYVGTNYWGKGRTQEIKERYVHMTDIAEDL